MEEEYSLEYAEGWNLHFTRFDGGTQDRILKKIQKLRQPLVHRHLKHGVPYFVEEAGGYRIVFQTDERKKSKMILFIGDHK